MTEQTRPETNAKLLLLVVAGDTVRSRHPGTVQEIEASADGFLSVSHVVAHQHVIKQSEA